MQKQLCRPLSGTLRVSLDIVEKMTGRTILEIYTGVVIRNLNVCLDDAVRSRTNG